MAVGLFGGAFDPVHATHVRIAAEALEQARLDRLFVVPNACPPHRGAPVAAVGHRLQMLRIALRGVPGAVPRNLESGEEEGPHYTIDTVEMIRHETGEDCIVLVAGADAVGRLDEWRSWRELVGMCGWLVVPRPGHCFPKDASPTVREEFADAMVAPGELSRAPGRMTLLEFESAPNASRDVRSGLRLQNGSEGVPPEVLVYIRRNGLYA